MNTSTRIRLAVAVALAGATVLAAGIPDARAQYYYRPHTRVAVAYPHGLYFGAGLAGTRILDQRGGAELLDHGGGLTLYTGFRVNRVLALELGWLGTLHNPERVDTVFGRDVDYLMLNGFTADARVFLGSSSSVEPFVQAGVGAYLLDSTYFGAQSVGTGFQAGGGLDASVARSVTLGLRVLYRGLAMGPPRGRTNDTFVSALTLDANVTVHF